MADKFFLTSKRAFRILVQHTFRSCTVYTNKQSTEWERILLYFHYFRFKIGVVEVFHETKEK